MVHLKLLIFIKLNQLTLKSLKITFRNYISHTVCDIPLLWWNMASFFIEKRYYENGSKCLYAEYFPHKIERSSRLGWKHTLSFQRTFKIVSWWTEVRNYTRRSNQSPIWYFTSKIFCSQRLSTLLWTTSINFMRWVLFETFLNKLTHSFWSINVVNSITSELELNIILIIVFCVMYL